MAPFLVEEPVDGIAVEVRAHRAGGPALATAEGVRLLRLLVRAAFDDHGLPVTVTGDSATDGQGRQYSLLTVMEAARAADLAGEDWGAVVTAEVAELVREVTGPSALERLPTEELLGRIHPLVVDAANLPVLEAAVHAPFVAPGFHEFLAVEAPQGMQTLSRADEERLGDPVGLRFQARNNLRGLLIERHEVVRDQDGTRFDVVSGSSMFTAGRMTYLDDLVDELTGLPLGPEGAVFAFPSRYELAFHAIRGRSLYPSLAALARWARTRYAEVPDGLSPHLHWWLPGEVIRLTDYQDGEYVLRIAHEFKAVLEGLETTPGR
ncbi:hypothetical protein ACGFZP_28640 [Kitasatospora sp. NPDC048239]|uniref:hypothetical protein n=1 Tax=Kitasatospora sp. NPDC048239 TaxID=3364046 RepID=UPI003714F5A7